MFLFEFSALFEPLSRQEDLYIREILVTLWTNFASTGYVKFHFPSKNVELGLDSLSALCFASEYKSKDNCGATLTFILHQESDHQRHSRLQVESHSSRRTNTLPIYHHQPHHADGGQPGKSRRPTLGLSKFTSS